MLKITIFFKKFMKPHGKISQKFSGLRMRNFQGTAFI